MRVKPLTNAEIKNAKPKDRDYALYDGFGLLLNVRKSGSKVWHFRYYSPYTKKRQTMVIGPYPEISLADARERRLEARRHIANGADPNEVKRERIYQEKLKNENTLSVFYNDWIKYKESQGLAEASLYGIKGEFRRTIIPDLGDIPVSKLTPRMIMPFLNGLRDSGSIRAMRTSSSLLRQLMDYAVNTGVIEYNPLAKISSAIPKVASKNYVTISAHELPEFLLEIENAYMSENVKLMAEWQLLTMVRPIEARGTRWEELDLHNAEWVIPASRMKKRMYHVVPLSTQALNIIEKMKSRALSDEYMFPALKRGNNPLSGNVIGQMISETSFKGRIVPHGFRALASTTLHEHGFNPDVIEAALAHKCRDVIRGIYNRSTYLEQRRVMMQWWGDFVEAAKRGEVISHEGSAGLRLVYKQ